MFRMCHFSQKSLAHMILFVFDFVYIFSAYHQVGSQCTILTDNYCEDAYELLDTPILKKLLVLI